MYLARAFGSGGDHRVNERFLVAHDSCGQHRAPVARFGTYDVPPPHYTLSSPLTSPLSLRLADAASWTELLQLRYIKISVAARKPLQRSTNVGSQTRHTATAVAVAGRKAGPGIR